MDERGDDIVVALNAAFTRTGGEVGHGHAESASQSLFLTDVFPEARGAWISQASSRNTPPRTATNSDDFFMMIMTGCPKLLPKLGL